MEELKILVGMVAELPTMAIWVIIFYFVYKVIIVGSIYGVIKLGIRKMHEVLIKEKEADIRIFQWFTADKLCISSDNTKKLIERCLYKIVGKGTTIETEYIHQAGASWLMEAILEKEQREREAEREKTDVGSK